MISRFDKIAVDLPRPKNPSANDAAAVQELLGGRFGEMSTLMNYTFQSFNFRGRNKLRPFYDVIASIAAEEYSHIETLSYAINLLLTGTTVRGKDPSKTPLADATDARNTYHFIASGQTALPMDSRGWTRVFLGSAMDVEIDGSSRVLIAPELRASAGLVRDVMLLGMGSHFELWDAERHQAHEQAVMRSPLPESLKTFSF